METGTKVAIGVGAAVVGFGIYWFFIREGEEVATAVGETGGGTGGGGGGSAGVIASTTSSGGRVPVSAKPVAIQINLKPTATQGRGTPASSPVISAGQGRGTPASSPVISAGQGRGADGSVSWQDATGYTW